MAVDSMPSTADPFECDHHSGCPTCEASHERAACGTAAPCQGPDRYGGDPHNVRLAHLCGPRPHAKRHRSSSAPSVPALSSSARRTCRSSPGACSGKTRGTGPSTIRASPGKTTGGSSAGNAAALAAGLAELGIGSDTGCSIRLPSAACGTVGLKPRWGAIPNDGVFPLAPTLDTVGPMARSVADVALLWSVLAERPVPAPRLDGLVVGLLRQPPAARRRSTDGEERPCREMGEPTSSGWARACGGESSGCDREYVSAVPPRGEAVSRCHVSRAR